MAVSVRGESLCIHNNNMIHYCVFLSKLSPRASEAEAARKYCVNDAASSTLIHIIYSAAAA